MSTTRRTNPLSLLWTTPLPKYTSTVTTPLVNHHSVYAGNMGYIYQLDYLTGRILAKNGLDGLGNNEIRLASPPDASILVIGPHGYAVGLDPLTLTMLWGRSLPGAGYEVVSVLCANGSVYVGSNGYVYLLYPSDGHMEEKKVLRGRGSAEVRVAMSRTLERLFIGINGYALGLDPIALATKWETSLLDYGHEITSVIGGDRVAYAASNGRVYRLSESSGRVTHKDKLDRCGSSEVVEKVLSRDGTKVYAGSNGHGIALRSDDLRVLYKASLLGSGHTVTDVVETGQFGCFANNGYIFQIDNNGYMRAKNTLDGLGCHEVRLAVVSGGVEQLLAGINGHTVAMAI